MSQYKPFYKYFLARHPKNPFKKRGTHLNITPSFLCNYNCSYPCAVNYEGKKPIHCEPAKAHEWIRYIEKFPDKVVEISLSGGEPTLLPYFAFLCNSLLDRGYYLLVYSNISKPDEFLEVKQSRRFIIIATYHKEFTTAEKFTENYNKIKAFHQIKVDELGFQELEFGKLKPYATEWDRKNTLGLRISPDFSIYTNCTDMVNSEGKKMKLKAIE